MRCAILLIIIMLLTVFIKNYFQPFFTILFLFIFTTPIYNFMNKLNIFNNKINAVLSVVFVNVILIVAIALFGNVAAVKIKELYLSFIESFYLKPANNNIINNLNLNNFQNNFKELLNGDFLRKSALYTTDTLVAYFVGNISCYFILVDKCVIFENIKGVISEKSVQIIQSKYIEIKKMLFIEITLMLITTFFTIVGFVILQIKNAVFLGLLCGILDILPYVGTVLVFLPLIILYVLSNNYIVAFGMVILYILLQFNRQIMEAKFMSKKLKVHPLIMLMSIYIGGKVFGLIGLLVGPIYILIAKEVLLS